jgi:hypothetical protein
VSTRSAQIEFNLDDVRALQAFAENVGAAIRHAEQAEWMRATIRRLQEQREHHSGLHNAHPVQSVAHAEPGTDT